MSDTYYVFDPDGDLVGYVVAVGNDTDPRVRHFHPGHRFDREETGFVSYAAAVDAASDAAVDMKWAAATAAEQDAPELDAKALADHYTIRHESSG